MTITMTNAAQAVAPSLPSKRVPTFAPVDPISIQEALDFRVRSIKKTPMTKYAAGYTTAKTQQDYDPVKEQQDEAGQRLNVSYFSDELMTVIQNGYRTKKEYQTAAPDEEPKNVKITKVAMKSFGPALTSTDINTEKMTFRSGYQALGKEDQQAEYDLLLKGSEFPIKITGQKMYGSQNGANGYNGLQKSNLYLATYLDPDGVGNRPK